MPKEVPKFETKQVKQYSREGVNLRDLITSQVGGDDAQSFQKYLNNTGVSRRDMRRLNKAYETIQSSGKDYILSEDGSGFNVFDQKTGAAETRSGRATGNTKGVNLADLVKMGDNVSKLAGFAAQGIDNFRKSKQPIVDTTSRGLPASKTSDVNLTGDPEIDLVDYKPTTVGKGKSSTQIGGTKIPTKNRTLTVEADNSGPQPGDGENPYAGVTNPTFEAALAKVKQNRAQNPMINEDKLAEHMKSVKGQFSKRLLGMSSNSSFFHGPMSGPTNPKTINATADMYADRAAAIYEGMIREGYTPDIEEIASLIQNNELEQINKGLETNLNLTLSAISLGKLGMWGFRGGATGMKTLASKYPNFAKWLASKGVGKPLQFPAKETLPSVSSGAKEFLKSRAISRPSRYNWDWMNERIGTGFGEGGKLPIQASINTVAKKATQIPQITSTRMITLKSLMNY